MISACSTGGGSNGRQSRHNQPFANRIHTPCRRSLFDAVIIGAGAAGLFCAGQAGQRGLKVLLIDHSEKGGREDPHLGRRALQLHQPRPGCAGAAQALCGAEPAVLPLCPVALHPGRLHCAGAKHGIPFHESTRASCLPTVRPKTSSPCCWPNAKQAGSRAGSRAASKT